MVDAMNRRHFVRLAGALGSGLAIGFWFDTNAKAQRSAVFAPHAFVRMTPDDIVTVVVNKSEMGQGIHTSLAMLVADELDCEWNRVRLEAAPVTREYNDPIAGEYITAGSTSIVVSWEPFRYAGALARALLCEAAARRWSVDAAALRTDRGWVFHDATARRASYGALVAAAAGVPLPVRVSLKRPREYRLIGTNVPRIDAAEIVAGALRYSIDLEVPEMLTALVARPPVHGATVRRVRTAKAQAVPGVVKTKRLSTGVAVLAKGFWAAYKGREALEIEWNDGPNARVSSAALRNEYRRLAEKPGKIAENVGDVDRALAACSRTFDAVFEVPYLAHAPMEPLNAVAHVTSERCDVWAGTEYQSMDHRVARAITGLPAERVHIHTMPMGGAFGRRANPTSDFVAEAVEAARGENVPVKTVWTREDDIRGGYYRPMVLDRMRAGLDDGGMPVAWHHRIVGQSVGAGTVLEPMMLTRGIDMTLTLGAYVPYSIDHRRIDVHHARPVVSVLWWRSVGHSHTAFAAECFLDELAHAAGHDPVDLRRRLLQGKPRHLAVLELAAEKAQWNTPAPPGRARGVAMRQSFGTFVAQIAEVSISAGGHVRVHRVVCAVDCGVVINPRNVAAQMESAIVYGLSAALHGELTLDKGRVQQSNFHDYPVLRIDEMPEIDVHIVKSDELPGGAGEPGLPPLAPAVCNAVFALTGRRVRRLPIRLSDPA